MQRSAEAEATGRGPGCRRASIEAVAVSKRYERDGPSVVDDVSLEARQGELLTLLGPSGSGKTTLLMIVAGFEAPTAGEVKIEGSPVNGVPPQRRNLGIVFQSYALFPHLTVRENVEFSLRVRGVDRQTRRSRALEMLDVVGMKDFASRRPHEISGGQQQRTALARALVFEPAALLLDEPLGALDRQLRESLQTEIKAVQARIGTTILYVTHDQEEALRLSDRIAVMHDGRIEQVASPEDVYRDPASLFVARFFGETNVLPCTILGSNGKSADVRYAAGEVGSVRRPPGQHTAVGTQGYVAVRPEHIVLYRLDSPLRNRACGTLKETVFLGPTVRYRIGIGDHDIVMRRPASEAAELDLLAEQEVEIAWSEDDARVFCDSSSKGSHLV